MTPGRRAASAAGALLVAAGLALAQPTTSEAAVDLAAGRVVHFTGSAVDGRLRDLSGKGNSGTLANPPAALRTAPSHDGTRRVLRFERTDRTRVDVGVDAEHNSPAPSLQVSRFTVASWIDITEDDTPQPNWEVAEVEDRFWLNVRNGNDSTANHADADDPHHVLRCGAQLDVAGVRRAFTVTGSRVVPHGATGQHWTHVACVYDGATLTLFLDGQPDGSVALPAGTTLWKGDGAFTVAANDKQQWAPDYYHNWFDGSLDDFRFYGRPLSRAEVGALASR